MKMKNTANNDSPGPDFDFGPDAAHAAERIACLAGFMTPERYAVLRKTVSMRTRYMTVLAENMYHGQNAAALIRHCEAFGVQEMHTVETLCPFEPNPDIARGTHQWVDVRRHASTGEAVAALKGAGYRIVATTPHREDATPETFDVGRGPFALVFGTEHAGISDEVIASADEFLRIPMCGMVESLNVSASAAILIYTLSERMRLTVGNWRMSDAEQAETLCRWMRRSVKDSEAILQRRGAWSRRCGSLASTMCSTRTLPPTSPSWRKAASSSSALPTRSSISGRCSRPAAPAGCASSSRSIPK